VQNLMQIPPKGAFPRMREIYANIFIYGIYLFSKIHLKVRLLAQFLRAITQTTLSHARMCLLGIKKFEINIKGIYSNN